MLIQPESEVRILSGVKLDPGYNNTILWTDENSQSLGFDSMATYRLSDFTYVKDGNAIRVPLTVKELLGCSYLMFRNRGFENKWFYAFITDIEYLNTETTLVRFKLDVIQTWLFQMELLESFVERATDGNPLSLESFNYGPIKCVETTRSGYLNEYGYAVFASQSYGSLYPPGFVSGNYIGAFHRYYNDVNRLREIFESASTNPEELLGAVYMPSAFYQQEGSEPVAHNINIEKPDKIGQYTPRHKKLLRYPYNYLIVDSGTEKAEYRYEWFNTDTCGFRLYGTMSLNPQILCVPLAYNSSQYFNYTESVLLQGFPQLSFNTSGYKQWEARSAVPTMAGNVLSLASNLQSRSPAGIASSIGGIMETMTGAQLLPDHNHGSNSGSIDVAIKSKDFYFKKMQITEDYARMIDDWLDRFGDTVNRIQRPSIASRVRDYSYVKCSNASVSGDIPKSDLAEIIDCFNRGITFWTSNGGIGKY